MPPVPFWSLPTMMVGSTVVVFGSVTCCLTAYYLIRNHRVPIHHRKSKAHSIFSIKFYRTDKYIFFLNVVPKLPKHHRRPKKEKPQKEAEKTEPCKLEDSLPPKFSEHINSKVLNSKETM